jgi:exodeoxyribonuclease VII small subunit
MLSDTPVESLGYEEALQELDQLTRLVEQGQLSLQDALRVRQRGDALFQRAQALLDQFLQVLQQGQA